MGALAWAAAATVGAQVPTPTETDAAMQAAAPQAAGGSATLAQWVTVAWARAPRMREALAQSQAAGHDLTQARGALWPRLELNANSTAAKIDQAQASGLSGRVGATLSYSLWDFGKARSAIAARQADAAATQAKYRQVREDIANDTVSAVLQGIRLQRLIQVYQQHVADLGELVRKLSGIVEVVPGRRSELTQALARLGQVNDALLSLQAQQREAQLVLLRLLGPQPTPGGLIPLPTQVALAAQAPSQWLPAAQARHPGWLAARHEAEAAQAQVDELRAGRQPQLDVVLSKQSGRDVYGQASPAQAYLSARWLAFDGRSNEAGELALVARAQAAQERAAQVQQELDYRVQSAWADYEAQGHRMRQLASLVQHTDQVRQDYHAQWRELGRRSLLDVLSAESEHLNTRVSLVNSEVGRQLALARMHYEAGQLADQVLEASAGR